MWTLPVCTCMAGVTSTLRLGPPLWATLMCPLGTRVHFPSQTRDPVGSTGPVVVTGHTDPQKQMRLGAPKGGVSALRAHPLLQCVHARREGRPMRWFRARQLHSGPNTCPVGQAGDQTLRDWWVGSAEGPPEGTGVPSPLQLLCSPQARPPLP